MNIEDSAMRRAEAAAGAAVVLAMAEAEGTGTETADWTGRAPTTRRGLLPREARAHPRPCRGAGLGRRMEHAEATAIAADWSEKTCGRCE